MRDALSHMSAMPRCIVGSLLALLAAIAACNSSARRQITAKEFFASVCGYGRSEPGKTILKCDLIYYCSTPFPKPDLLVPQAARYTLSKLSDPHFGTAEGIPANVPEINFADLSTGLNIVLVRGGWESALGPPLVAMTTNEVGKLLSLFSEYKVAPIITSSKHVLLLTSPDGNAPKPICLVGVDYTGLHNPIDQSAAMCAKLLALSQGRFKRCIP